MKTNKRVVITSLVSVIALAGWYAKHSGVTKVKQLEPAVSMINSNSLNVNQALSKTSGASVAVTAFTNVKPQPDQLKLLETTELLKQLNQIHVIQKKVFKSEAELEIIKSFISSRSRLQSLVTLFTNRQLLIETSSADQSAAVDVLIEASKSESAQYAEELILEIIRDSRIENENEIPAVRESLAGIKAELMYHAVRIDNRTVQNSISGPVTQKIWNNVQQAQADNVSESQLERQAQVAQQSR